MDKVGRYMLRDSRASSNATPGELGLGATSVWLAGPCFLCVH